MTPGEGNWFARGLWAGAAAACLMMGASIGLARCAHGQEIATSDPALICGKVDGMSYIRQHRGLLLEDERRADFARYGVPWSEHRRFEDDHWEPLCLGGADTPANRRPQRCDAWRGPECIAGPAAEKDVVEQRACRAVCEAYRHGTDADDLIRDWQAVFAQWRYAP